jgi:protoheme IX farnesyltransferase
MMTAGVACYVGSRGDAGFLLVIHTLLGTVLATAGALALNQYIERRVDSVMERTRARPLPSGRLPPANALLFGLLLVLGGVGYLWAMVGVLPALLTLFSAAAYDLIYTPLKSRSYAATFAGSVPGAMPALIGWSAATGEISTAAMALFAIAFLWQLPHVLALAWILREDYARAGFHMGPAGDPEGRALGMQMVLYAGALVPVSLSPTLLGVTGWIYFTGALVVGFAYFVAAIIAWREMSSPAVRRVFLGSLAYQPLILGLMLLDTTRL